MDYCFGFRTCGLDYVSQNDFKYPDKGYAQCDDWKDTNECGSGLHYLKDFKGDWSLTEITRLPEFRCQLLKIKNTFRGKNNIRSIHRGQKHKSKRVQVLGTFFTLEDMKNYIQSEFLPADGTEEHTYKQEILRRLTRLIAIYKPKSKIVERGEVAIAKKSDTNILNGGTLIIPRSEYGYYNSCKIVLLDLDSKVVILNDDLTTKKVDTKNWTLYDKKWIYVNNYR